MVNVICIKWGDKYPAPYVNKLYGMVRRNLKRGHRFVCFTDDPRGDIRPEVELMPIPPIKLPEYRRNRPWRKVSLFAPTLGNVTGPTLFLDLDIVIAGGLDDFFDHRPGDFCVAENWSQKGTGIGNTSVYRFEVGKFADLYEHFHAKHDEVMGGFRNSQTFISRYLGEQMVYWPHEWVRSFKLDCLPPFVLRPFVTPKVPFGARVIAFPGEPKMPDAAAGKWPGGLHKFLRPSPWITEYWKE